MIKKDFSRQVSYLKIFSKYFLSLNFELRGLEKDLA